MKVRHKLALTAPFQRFGAILVMLKWKIPTQVSPST